MQFLEKHFQFIDLDEVAEAISTQNFPPDLSVAITFDDGLRSFSTDAFPIIQEMNIPAAVYVTTGLIDSEFWRSTKMDQLIVNGRIVKGNTNIPLPRDRVDAASLGYEIRQGLSLDELVQVDNHDKVTVGAHTMNHPILTTLSQEESTKEITGSKLQLEEWLGHDIRHFAYPNGNYSSREIEIIRAIGFTSCAAVGDKWITAQSESFSFPRKGTGPSVSSLYWLMYRIYN